MDSIEILKERLSQCKTQGNIEEVSELCLDIGDAFIKQNDLVSATGYYIDCHIISGRIEGLYKLSTIYQEIHRLPLAYAMSVMCCISTIPDETKYGQLCDLFIYHIARHINHAQICLLLEKYEEGNFAANTALRNLDHENEHHAKYIQQCKSLLEQLVK
jgi:hypothetical protein